MYANIVVALDGSDAAKRALSEAIQLARLSRGRLTAVYVVDQSAAFTYAGACDPHLLTDAARQVGLTLLHAAREQMRELNVVGETEIVETRLSKSRKDSGIVTFRHIARNQRDEIVCTAVRTGLMMLRPADKA